MVADSLVSKRGVVKELPPTMFALPKFIAEDSTASDLVDVYWVFVDRLKEEVKLLPLNTLQQMLLERVCTNYIILRWRERKGFGETDGFEHSTAAKDFNSFWLMTHKELNAQLKLNADDFRDNYAQLVREGVQEALADFAPDTQRLVRTAMAKSFAAKGL